MQEILVFLADPQREKIFKKQLSGITLQFTQSDIAGQLNDKIGLVVIDGGQALEQLKDIRSRGIYIPVIIIGTEFPLPELIKAVKYGRAIVFSPQDLEHLAVVIRKYLERPVQAEQMLEPWLLGNSALVKKIRQELQALAKVDLPVFLFGEQGCGKREIARFLQKNFSPDREMIELNLDNFSAVEQEPHIWSALKEIYKRYDTELPEVKQPLYGLLYIKGLENKDILFLISLLEWLYEQRSETGVFGSTLRVVVGLESQELLEKIPKEFFEKYAFIGVPPLREHREDLPFILDSFISQFNQTYRQSIATIAPAAWEYIFSARWSGNIEELRYNLETVFLAQASEKNTIELSDLCVNQRQLSEYILNMDNRVRQKVKTEIKDIFLGKGR